MAYLDDLFAWAAQQYEDGNNPTVKAGLVSYFGAPVDVDLQDLNVYATGPNGSLTYYPPQPIRGEPPLGPPEAEFRIPPYFMGAVTLTLSELAFEIFPIPRTSPPSPVSLIIQAPSFEPTIFRPGEIAPPAIYTLTVGEPSLVGWQRYILGSNTSESDTFQQVPDYQVPTGWVSSWPFDGYEVNFPFVVMVTLDLAE